MAEEKKSASERRYGAGKPAAEKAKVETSKPEKEGVMKQPDPKPDDGAGADHIAAMHERHKKARHDMHKRHEKEHRDLHGQHRDAIRDMHGRHEQEETNLNGQQDAELAGAEGQPGAAPQPPLAPEPDMGSGAPGGTPMAG